MTTCTTASLSEVAVSFDGSVNLSVAGAGRGWDTAAAEITAVETLVEPVPFALLMPVAKNRLWKLKWVARWHFVIPPPPEPCPPEPCADLKCAALTRSEIRTRECWKKIPSVGQRVGRVRGGARRDLGGSVTSWCASAVFSVGFIYLVSAAVSSARSPPSGWRGTALGWSSRGAPDSGATRGRL